MLNRLDDFYNKLIYENAEDIWIRKITTDTEFFNTYLKPLITKYDVDIYKARLNTFRLGGHLSNVLDALKNIKVDNEYWNDDAMGRKFCLYSPMVTFGEIIHYMNYDEGYPANTVDTNSLYAMQNKVRYVIEGRWYELNELDKNNQFDYLVRAKSATPTDLVKMIENLVELQSREKDNCVVVVEFILNCQNLANQVFDEQSVFIPETSEDFITKINDSKETESKPTVVTKIEDKIETNNVKIPEATKQGKTKLSKAVVNSYDKKNKFKKTTKEIK